MGPKICAGGGAWTFVGAAGFTCGASAVRLARVRPMLRPMMRARSRIAMIMMTQKHIEEKIDFRRRGVGISLFEPASDSFSMKEDVEVLWE